MIVTVAQVRSTPQLLDFIAGGGQPKFLFFWGHQPQPDGSAGKGCLSQWWPAEFTVDGVTYPSAEHFMMTAKALLCGDMEMAGRIPLAPHPGEAKALGRQVHGFDEERWAERRFGLVVAGNVAKFGQHPQLRDYLLTTGDRVLVEASPRDRVWGIGMAASNELATSPEHWRGANLLGFALMEARHQLRTKLRATSAHQGVIMTFTEVTLRNGIEASTGIASFTCLVPMVYPDGRVAVSVDVGADAGHEYLLHPGETFPVHDQTWKLDRIENPGSDDWQVHLVRVS